MGGDYAKETGSAFRFQFGLPSRPMLGDGTSALKFNYS